METVRKVIRDQVLQLVGGGGSRAVDLDRPRGDPGLFGPASASWQVHADFTTMMVGGISALLTQMLHPLALAGVWDHSNFRHDMTGRLARTAQFIAGTTYGGRDEALRLIDHVKAIHDRVSGTLPDGTPYSANDPVLLTWVHAAEAYNFLAAYLRHRDPAFPLVRQDLYFAESAQVAERLGARDVPRSRAEMEAYFRAMQPALRVDARTREMAHVLLGQSGPSSTTTAFGKLVTSAAIDLLPGWARAMHGLKASSMARPSVDFGIQGMGAVLRWALNDGSAARARRRVA